MKSSIDISFRLQLKGDYSIALYFDPYFLPSSNNKKTMAYPLYPFGTYKLSIIFVYGTDFTRRMNIMSIPGPLQILAGLIALFVGLATIILCIIRRKWKLRGDGLIA